MTLRVAAVMLMSLEDLPGKSMDTASYTGLFFIIALTGCGLPFPEEAAIVAAGILSANGRLNWVVAFLSCVLGVVAGDFTMYLAGSRGHNRIMQLLVRLPPREPSRMLAQFRTLAARYPILLMALAHLTVGFRPFVYFTLGLRRTPTTTFLVYESVCALAVVTACFAPAYLVGEVVLTWFQNVGLGITGFLVVALGIGVTCNLFSRFAQRRKAQHATGAEHSDHLNSPAADG